MWSRSDLPEASEVCFCAARAVVQEALQVIVTFIVTFNSTEQAITPLQKNFFAPNKM
jgi:hypothetical protein